MLCPKCKRFKTMVRQTTYFEDYVRRRRVCLNVKCKWRFTTVEAVVPEYRSMIDNVVKTIRNNITKMAKPK